MKHGHGNDGLAMPGIGRPSGHGPVGMNGTAQAMGDQCGDQNGCPCRGRDRRDGSIKVEEAAVAPGGVPRRAMRNLALLAMCQALTQSSNTLMNGSSALAVC